MRRSRSSLTLRLRWLVESSSGSVVLSDEFESEETFPPPSRTVVRILIFESLPPADDADGFSLDADGRRRVRPCLVRIRPVMVEGGGDGGLSTIYLLIARGTSGGYALALRVHA